MTVEELYAWSAYYTLKADAEKKAYEESRRQAQYRNMRQNFYIKQELTVALGAEYKVNIKLDTKEFDAQLKTLQTKVNNIGKVAVRGGRGGA